MDIKIKKGAVSGEKSDAAVFMLFEGEKPAGALSKIDGAQGGVISRAIASGEFTGKPGETALFHLASKTGPERIILAGLGRREKFSPDSLMRAAGAAAGLAGKTALKEISAYPAPPEGISLHQFASLTAQGMLLALYNFDRFKKAESDRKVKSLTLPASDRAAEIELKKGAAEGRIIADSVNFAKDMINAPANEMTPSVMAARAKAAARDVGLKLKILEADDCKRLGMGAFLGVAMGSKQPPKFIVLEYNGAKPVDRRQGPYVIIGKGITFDSGGISIKPSEGMEKMKYDMAGAGAVIAAIRCAAALKLPVNLVAIAPCTENMPGGAALKPGDMVRAMNGKTIEVISTDAEGRLVLADALTYTARQGAEAMIDLATLTGASVVALGLDCASVFGTSQSLVDDILAAAGRTGELMWPMPLWPQYRELIRGDVADVKNSGGRPAGAVTAALFLKEFTEGVDWAHLDIAGPAWTERVGDLTVKGGTGYPVRTLLAFLEARAAGR